MKKIAFSFAPPKDQLDEIERWLIEEDNLKGEGFYCNWEIIASSFDKKNLATVSLILPFVRTEKLKKIVV